MHNYSVNPISRPGLPVQSSLSFDRPSDVDWVTSEVIFGRICDPPIDPATKAARAAYTDERYFVEISRPTSTVTQDGELAVEADPTVDSRQRIVTAYNTGEFLSGTHTLQVGELVRLRKRVYDYATRRVVMYVFSSGGGGGGSASIKWGKVKTTWASGNTITLVPWTQQVDGAATGEADITAYINSPSSASPLRSDLTADAIVAYMTDDDDVNLLLPTLELPIVFNSPTTSWTCVTGISVADGYLKYTWATWRIQWDTTTKRYIVYQVETGTTNVIATTTCAT